MPKAIETLATKIDSITKDFLMRTLASYHAVANSASGQAAWRLTKALLVVLMAAIASGVAAQPAATEGETPDALDQALEQPPPAEDAQPADRTADDQQTEAPPYLPPPEGTQRLSQTDRAWVDRERGIVIVDGRIALRRGLLEMFACPPNTKEHESVVAVQSKAFVIHAGLLAVGAEPGTPVKFSPEYKPPTGTEIEIEVLWRDEQGKEQKTRAQNWVRDARTREAMDLPWVFAGSGFWRDEQTGASGYMAESGDLVCVANFSTAMLDVPAKLTNDNAGLLFEAYTERIPPLGWPVRLVFKPVSDDEQDEGSTTPAGQSSPDSTPPSDQADEQPGSDQPQGEGDQPEKPADQQPQAGGTGVS